MIFWAYRRDFSRSAAGFFVKQLRKTEDRVERRADLVRHVRQEFALELVGPEQLDVPFRKLGDLGVELDIGLAQLRSAIPAGRRACG